MFSLLSAHGEDFEAIGRSGLVGVDCLFGGLTAALIDWEVKSANKSASSKDPSGTVTSVIVGFTIPKV